MSLNIRATFIKAERIQAKEFIGLKDEVGDTKDISLSESFDVTASGFKLTDTTVDPNEQIELSLSQGDIILTREDGSIDRILDTSNRLTEFTECDNLKITPSDTDKVALTITGSPGLKYNLVTIETNDGTDKFTDKFTIDNEGVTTIASSVLTTVDINGGSIDATTIGANTPSTGIFTSLDVNGSAGIILQKDNTITNSTAGTVVINGIVSAGTSNTTGVFKSNGDYDVTLQTGNSTTGSITIANGANGNIAITPDGNGFVNLKKISLNTKVITNISGDIGDILNTHSDKSVLYFNLSGNSTASIPDGTDGQVLHMFYGCSHNLAISFQTDGLKCGSGTANTLTFNADGQSASLVFIGNSINKWCILNTGAVIS